MISESVTRAQAVAPGYEPVRDHLRRVAADDPHYSAHFTAYVDGTEVVDIWAGAETDGDSLQGVFSATKGISAIALAVLVDRGLLDLDQPVAHYWPDFAQAGKGSISVRLALSHQAGLAGVGDTLTLARLLDHVDFAAAVAAQPPLWQPGAAHGYHALTMGTLIDELVRRIDGRSVAEFFTEEIATPRKIDFFIATDERQERRVVDVLPPVASAESGDTPDTAQDPATSVGLLGVAFGAGGFDPFHPPLPNRPAVRAAGVASVGGVATARGLARAYASCIGEVEGMPPLLSARTIAEMTRLQTSGTDLVLGFPTRYAIVFQVPDERLSYGSWRAFGHDGAGGAIGVADPTFGIAFGYIPRRMAVPGGADARGLALARTLRQCVAALGR